MDPLTIIVCLHTAYIHTHIYKEIKEIYVFFFKNGFQRYNSHGQAGITKARAFIHISPQLQTSAQLGISGSCGSYLLYTNVLPAGLL